MQKLPIEIQECPIIESILEIRYSSDFPADAIFGMIYGGIRYEFQGINPESLPILQLPEQVRLQDPNLKYQAYYRLSKDNLNFSIGPRTIIFSNLEPYIGWDDWSLFFNRIIEKIHKTNVISRIERIGLRYINSFSMNLLNQINVDFRINDSSINDKPTNIRTEFHEDKLIKVLQISNILNPRNPKQKKRTIIDIDCLYDINKLSNEFFDNHKEYIEYAHTKEKELFFNLLTEELLATLKPKYKED